MNIDGIVTGTRGYKKLGRIQNNSEYTKNLRDRFYDFYFNYFYNMIINLYEWQNLPDDVDTLFVERKLVNNGFVGLFHDKKYGYVMQAGTMGSTLDMYERPLQFVPVNPAVSFNPRHIVWSENTITTDKDIAVICGNNNQYTSYTDILALFAQKLADIEALMHINRVGQVNPYIVVAEQNNILSLTNIVNRIFDFNPVIYVNKQKSKGGLEEDKQLTDYIKTFNTQTPYIVDKLTDDRNNIINQILTFFGINNNPIDKKERLVSSEADSNNQLIATNLEVSLKSRKLFCELANKIFDLDIQVDLSERIGKITEESVKADLGFSEEVEDEEVTEDEAE